MKVIRTDFDKNYTVQDWAEIKLAKETTKINPEGEKIRLKIIERNKCSDTSPKTQIISGFNGQICLKK